jgi:hypothetical protein
MASKRSRVRPRLKSNWRQIVKRAWSVRLIAGAAVLQGGEVILPPFFGRVPDRQRVMFAIVMLLVIAGAFVSRIVVQKGMR